MTHSNDPKFYDRKPSVMLVQEPDGSYKLEYMTDGYRHVINVPRGEPTTLAWEIGEAMMDQTRTIARQKAEAIARQQDTERRRQNAVWRGVATNHGIEFANKVINGTNSNKINAKRDAKPLPLTAKQMIDLL